MSTLLTNAPFAVTAASTSNSRATKVLLVEDNESDALLVRTALAGLTDRNLYESVFDVHTAGQLSAATVRLSKEHFDVILLDLSLPDSSSPEGSFFHIREHAGGIPIIVLTGVDDEILALRMARDGAQDYLIKSRLERYLLVKAIRYAIERQRSEQALRKSEEDFRSIVETTREWIWSIDLEGRLKYSNPTVESILGYKSEELLEKPIPELLYSPAAETFQTHMAQAIYNRHGWSGLILRWRHKDGSVRWLESNSTPMHGDGGDLIGFRGSDRDITERELAKLAHARLQLRLLAVQEQERHRIARELHDQMGQSIAALMLGLKSLAQAYETEQARPHFEQLQKLAGELAKDVHSLALDLRPTALDDLGLEVALSNHLDTWSSRWQIPADFMSRGFRDRRLAPHLETNIYRITQEALTNIVRHARARRVSLILERSDDTVILIIEDDGCGFDVKTVMKNPETEQRLGLLGMEERVALVGGSLSIESAQGRGTTLYVRIPISPQENGEVA